MARPYHYILWSPAIYSYLNASTGFRVAAVNMCQLMVMNAIRTTIAADTAKIHHDISVLYAKLCNHCCIKYHDAALPTTIDTTISLVKSFERSKAICETEAPEIFRMPISFVRLLVKYEA